jgi:hypothetical protein
MHSCGRCVKEGLYAGFSEAGCCGRESDCCDSKNAAVAITVANPAPCVIVSGISMFGDHLAAMRINKALIAAAFLTRLGATFAYADGISLETWRGSEVLRLSGEITLGLADELAAKIQQATTRADGTRVLLLDSPGGSVDEALRISEVLDKFPMHTVVPNGASCASACGSIIFLAGKFRTVEVFGRIGQHSCARGGQPDQVCNEQIAAHAVAHGVSFGSIAAFVTYTLPTEMIWFSREDVDGCGLSRYPGEAESGFQKSEPRVIKMLTGTMPPAQSAWRLDFHGDGYRAFLRPVSDAEREMQINLFCFETLPGRLFLSMEVNGDVAELNRAITKVSVTIEGVSWAKDQPITLQDDSKVATVVMEIPSEMIRRFLTSSDRLVFEIDLQKPYVPMQATTYLASSRKNLLFAANNCARAEYDMAGQLIPRP